jgi:hypothetical protein
MVSTIRERRLWQRQLIIMVSTSGRGGSSRDRSSIWSPHQIEETLAETAHHNGLHIRERRL